MTSISVHALFVFQFWQTTCTRTPASTMIALGSNHTHLSPVIKRFWGVYMCVKCVTTAVTKLIHLKYECGECTTVLKHNSKAYAEGKAPKLVVGWPYSSLQANDKVIVKTCTSPSRPDLETYEPEIVRQEALSQSSSCDREGSWSESVTSGSSCSDRARGRSCCNHTKPSINVKT